MSDVPLLTSRLYLVTNLLLLLQKPTTTGTGAYVIEPLRIVSISCHYTLEKSPIHLIRLPACVVQQNQQLPLVVPIDDPCLYV